MGDRFGDPPLLDDLPVVDVVAHALVVDDEPAELVEGDEAAGDLVLDRALFAPADRLAVPPRSR